MSHCVLGGTFTYVHAGHTRLLLACREFSKITIGLTSNAFVKRHKIYPSFPYEKRLAGLNAALKKLGLKSRTAIHCIDDEAGGAEKMRGVDTIIVSEETLQAAARINKMRAKNHLPQLHIVSVPLVYGDDLKKISCASIYNGKTALSGKLLKPLVVQAGTDNPTKIRGAALALKRVFGRKISVHGHEEHSRVPAHPFNQETFFGAKNRAHAAWKRAGGKCDYSLGIESGLFTMKKGLFVDITVCCAYDGKEETYGTGMGFVVPPEIARKIRKEGTDLGVVMKEMTGIDKIGRKQGALGYFSAGVLHRREQIEQSVACAFVPRIHRAKVEQQKD